MENEDKNKNGIPDWYESRVDDQTTFPEGDLGHAYTSEEKIAAKIPNYKEYKWYQNPAMDGHPGTEYFYTLGEKLEKTIETNPKKAKQTLNKIAKEDNRVSKKDVQPLIKEAEQVTDGDKRTSEVNNEVVNEVLENPKLEGLLDNVEIPNDNNDEVNNEVVSKTDFDKITPEELQEGSDIQKEAEQLYDDNPNNDEVNNEAIENTDIEKVADEVIPKEKYDAMPIDEIEQRDAESITEGKPYMAIAEDMGLGEEDLLYFEQPEFIEDLTPEQIEEVKAEPDKQKKIELLKSHYEGGNNDAPTESLGSTGVSGGGASIPNVSGNFQPYNNFVSDNPPMIGSFLGGAGNVGVGGRGGSIAAGSVSDYGFDDKEGNSTSSSKVGNGQNTNVEVEDLDANTASLNSANSVQHLDDSLDDLGFKDTKHNKEIKSNEQAELPSGEFHEKDREEFELKLPEEPTNDDIISYLEKDSANWENGDSKAKYLPFRFFIKDGELWGTVIGHGKPEKIKEFMKHEILAKSKISNIVKGV